MVFSSLPLYLDPPNWQQQQQGISEYHGNPDLQPQPLQAQAGGGDGGTATSIRPNSMVERARLAKIPQQDVPLKCPRCESMNTKFCYFNNYSLLQPRHFCKTCRRYWTRGGALRNVPVGGGCRRTNKRSKKGRSKSPISADITTTTTADQIQQRGLTASTSAVFSNTQLIGGHFLQSTPQLSFMAAVQNLTQLGIGTLGLNLEGIQPQVADFSVVHSNIPGAAAAQQLPFSGAGFDEVPSAAVLNCYPFQNGGVNEAGLTSYASGNDNHEINIRSRTASTNGVLASANIEKNHQRQNIYKELVAMPENNQIWGTRNNASVWTDLSGLNSSSTTSHII
ncbi:hypothetical protein Nepgr_009251 [Nepenthes gracilis]|uniref:Dof zinc finger protein n=1 Tax=Nepenthes gracilis TaxID=150966 RepID=A0AAD3XK77_NEPGR|nr:hypothetical protein Nepgr_009251 [Nepenthes gracilis]